MRYAVALFAVLLTAACGERLAQRERRTDLSDRLREFSKLIRWGHFDAAGALRLSRALADPAIVGGDPSSEEPDARDPGSEEGGPVALDPVRVTFFEHVGQTFNGVGDEAYVVSMIGYYHPDRPVLRQLRYRHTWWYHPGRKRWFLDSELPRFE